MSAHAPPITPRVADEKAPEVPTIVLSPKSIEFPAVVIIIYGVACPRHVVILQRLRYVRDANEEFPIFGGDNHNGKHQCTVASILPTTPFATPYGQPHWEISGAIICR